MSPVRAALYLRISEDKTGEEAGVSRQREDGRELIERRRWTLAGEFVDNDTSASGKVARPRFLELLAAIERGEIDAVVGWTMDRTLRSGRDRLRMLELGKAHGLTIALVRGSDMDLSTPSGRFAADILGAAALNEIEVKADRQRRAAVQRAEKGTPWISRRPFGFESDGITHRAAEAAEVRNAYAELIAGGSVRGIATRWNAAGITTSQSSQWRGAQVRQLLLSARNAGIRTHTTTDAKGKRSTKEVGPASWAGIVDETTYRAAVGILSDPSRRIGRDRVRKFLGTGLYRCGVCDNPVGSHRATSTGKDGYRCKGFDGSGGHVSRQGAPIDELITALVIARLAAPDARELLIDDTAPNMDTLRQEETTLRARLEAMAAEFGDDPTVPLSEYRTLTAKHRTRLAEIEQEMTSTSRVPILAELIGVEDVAAGWAKLDLARRRSVIDALMIVRILPTVKMGRGFDPDTLGIEWRL